MATVLVVYSGLLAPSWASGSTVSIVMLLRNSPCVLAPFDAGLQKQLLLVNAQTSVLSVEG